MTRERSKINPTVGRADSTPNHPGRVPGLGPNRPPFNRLHSVLPAPSHQTSKGVGRTITAACAVQMGADLNKPEVSFIHPRNTSQPMNPDAKKARENLAENAFRTVHPTRLGGNIARPPVNPCSGRPWMRLRTIAAFPTIVSRMRAMVIMRISPATTPLPNRACPSNDSSPINLKELAGSETAAPRQGCRRVPPGCVER